MSELVLSRLRSLINVLESAGGVRGSAEGVAKDIDEEIEESVVEKAIAGEVEVDEAELVALKLLILGIKELKPLVAVAREPLLALLMRLLMLLLTEFELGLKAEL